MIDLYLKASFICGTVVMIGLFISKFIHYINSKNEKWVINLSEGVVAFLTGSAIPAGIKLCVLSIDSNVFQNATNERLYIFLGGLTVIWVSIDTIWKVYTGRSWSDENQ